jgi:rubrerythrin
MRPSLRHHLGERRRTHRIRGAHRPDPAPEALAAAQEPDIAAQEPHTAAQGLHAAAQEPDIAAQRVREAGGPSDQASYACQCGYLFAAAVSTTVDCPHCGAPQAW